MWGDDGSSFIYEIPRRCTGEGFFKKKMVYKKFKLLFRPHLLLFS